MNWEVKMVFGTHIITAVALSKMFGAGNFHTLICSFFSVLPDIDNPSSIIGREAPILSRVLKHRGFNHSLISLCVIFFGTYNIFNATFSKFATLGWASHIFLDLLNPAGVQLFWPMHGKIRWGLVRCGGVGELIVLALILIFAGVKF